MVTAKETSREKNDVRCRSFWIFFDSQGEVDWDRHDHQTHTPPQLQHTTRIQACRVEEWRINTPTGVLGTVFVFPPFCHPFKNLLVQTSNIATRNAEVQ